MVEEGVVVGGMAEGILEVATARQLKDDDELSSTSAARRRIANEGERGDFVRCSSAQGSACHLPADYTVVVFPPVRCMAEEALSGRRSGKAGIAERSCSP